MKIAIIYSSKYGTTEKICCTIERAIKKHVEVDVVCIDSHTCLNLSEYDVIILGTSIYAGKPRKNMTTFCNTHHKDLLSRHLVLFICGMDREHAIKEIEAAYNEALINHSLCTTFFEGEYLLPKMNLADKLLLRIFFHVKKSRIRDYREDIKVIVDKLITL